MRHITIILASLLLLTSCNDFLDRFPLTTPNSETYLSGESQVKSYANGMYHTLPNFPEWGIDYFEADKNSDNIVTEEYNRRLNGEARVTDGEELWKSGYANLRKVNYFFNAYCVPEANETKNVIAYVGEMHFFRAYWHFFLLQRFGNVPIMDSFWDKNATVEGLQIAAAPRADVAKFILADLESAYAKCHDRSVDKGLRINKEAIMIFAMRVALYEGSWEKYHKGTPFSTSDQSEFFYKKVIEYGDKIKAELGGFKIYERASEDELGDSFADLFRTNDLSTIEEVAFWKKYSAAGGVKHTVQSVLVSGTTVGNSAAGVTQSLVDTYLNADGSCIDPSDEKFKDFNKTFEGRDPRMLQTIMSSGKNFNKVGSVINVRERKYLDLEDESMPEFEEPEDNPDFDIRPPYINQIGAGQCTTGYHRRLGADINYNNAITTNSETGYVYFRHAEALLAYAEACEELGKASDAVMRESVGKLRERAGVEYVAPKYDAAQDIYGYKISANLQEIRRERRVELAMQGYRLDDILRWRAHSLIKGVSPEGAYFGEDGVLYKSFTTDGVESILERIPLNSAKRLSPLGEIISGGYGFNESRDYLYAISPTELTLNKKLEQNPAWGN